MTSGASRHRRVVILRGTPAETLAAARRQVVDIPADEVLWLVDRAHAQARLGRAWDAVVLDLHRGLDPDALAAAHGFVRGGGALLLRTPAEGPPPRAALAVWPYGVDAVGTRAATRVLRDPSLPVTTELGPWRPPPPGPAGTPEQAALVDALLAAWSSARPTRTAILADRGRGKSAALGLALAARPAALRVALCAADDDALGEVVRFAGDLRRVEPLELADGPAAWDLVAIDEAARLPVPLLRAIHARHARAHQVWATTTGGYEGTGRGFELRFLDALSDPVDRHTLDEPIRWSRGDPLEAAVRRSLLLDARPDVPPASEEPLEVRTVPADALASDGRVLSAAYGLLVHAHPRTTPSDLERLLDAPNLDVHLALADGRVVGVCVTAREGSLPDELCDAMASGRTRIRGHALADTLVSHLGRRDAGRLSMVRSVRIAVHPGLRLRGVARALVEHVHAAFTPDLFGTMFGATPGLVAFRRAVGYDVVRVGVSRGSRTGEPAAVMVRPVSPAARALVHGLRDDLARDLPVQLDLLAADGDLAPDVALRSALMAGLPSPTPLGEPARAAALAGYTRGPRPFDAVIAAIREEIAARPGRLAALPSRERALLVGRALDGRAWVALAEEGGWSSVPAAMRALRRALAAW